MRSFTRSFSLSQNDEDGQVHWSKKMLKYLNRNYLNLIILNVWTPSVVTVIIILKIDFTNTIRQYVETVIGRMAACRMWSDSSLGIALDMIVY